MVKIKNCQNGNNIKLLKISNFNELRKHFDKYTFSGTFILLFVTSLRPFLVLSVYLGHIGSLLIILDVLVCVPKEKNGQNRCSGTSRFCKNVI